MRRYFPVCTTLSALFVALMALPGCTGNNGGNGGSDVKLSAADMAGFLKTQHPRQARRRVYGLRHLRSQNL